MTQASRAAHLRGCSVVKQIKPAGDIVRELARDAAAALAAAAAK